jgi:PhnB protein
MLAYEDPAAAIEWLSHAFGFEEDASERYTEPDGRITHAQLSLNGATIMLANPTPEYRSPKSHRQECETAARMLDNPWVVDGNLVYVDDVDAHYERARTAGAAIIRELEDPGIGHRLYSAEDLEGHRWMFSD